MQNDF